MMPPLMSLCLTKSYKHTHMYVYALWLLQCSRHIRIQPALVWFSQVLALATPMHCEFRFRCLRSYFVAFVFSYSLFAHSLIISTKMRNNSNANSIFKWFTRFAQLKELPTLLSMRRRVYIQCAVCSTFCSIICQAFCYSFAYAPH